MSKLDNIILDCANRVLDGKEEKLGDYIDPTKADIKALMLDIVTSASAIDDTEGEIWVNLGQIMKEIEAL